MGRRRSYTPLNIFMNSRLVGQLMRESTGAVSFVYERSWLQWENTLPVSLGLALREDRYVGEPVIAVFENLLPDNEQIRLRVAQKVGAHGTDAYNLLSAIGRDCVGALQFLPDGEEPQPLDRLDGKELSDTQVAAILKDLSMTPLGIRRENGFRISIAGAQEKTALLFCNGCWIEPTGTTPTTHIIKPQIGRLPNGVDLRNSVENEYLCLKFMNNFGLRVAKAEIVTFDDQKALVIERFDRHWTKDRRLLRLHQEDCCQTLLVPPTRKYQNDGGPGIVEIMNMLQGSDEPTQDRLNFFKTTILFWLMGATDGHAKNFSVRLLPRGRFRMTPLYDILTVQPMVDAQQIKRKDFRLDMRMGLSNHYRVGDIVGRHILETGLASGLSREVVLQIFDEIHAQANKAIEKTINELPDGFPMTILGSMAAAMIKRLSRLK